MQTKLIVALAVLFIVVIAAAILIALPTPGSDPENTPFVSENVIVTAPLPGSTVGKMISVRGSARGNWFFEANLPLAVKDPSGKQIGQGFAMATEEWMTTDFVPFEGKVEVQADYTGPAKLVVMKDNASGLPENDASVEFDIVVQ